jgi:hypothetical protein
MIRDVKRYTVLHNCQMCRMVEESEYDAITLDLAYSENARREAEKENERLRDLLYGAKCVYCGEVVGKETKNQDLADDVLKAHIANCPKHPLTTALRERDEARKEIVSIREEFDLLSKLEYDGRQQIRAIAEAQRGVCPDCYNNLYALPREIEQTHKDYNDTIDEVLSLTSQITRLKAEMEERLTLHHAVCTEENCILDGGDEHAEYFTSRASRQSNTGQR